MARVYAIASAKGGVGKTTTTANLGATLANTGADVVVIDGDIGMANLGAALGVSPNGTTLHDVLNGTADPRTAGHEGPSGLTVVPGDTSLEAFAAAEPQRLEAVVDAFDDADYILIDVGAGVSHETSVPLSVADAVVLVSTPDRDALIDTEKTRQLTERLGGVVAGAVITRTNEATPIEEVVSGTLSSEVLTTIPNDEAVRESIAVGEPLLSYAPHSDAAAAYRQLASALTGIDPTPPEPSPADVDTDTRTALAERDDQLSDSLSDSNLTTDSDGVTGDSPDDERTAATGDEHNVVNPFAASSDSERSHEEHPDANGPDDGESKWAEAATTTDNDGNQPELSVDPDSDSSVPQDAIPFSTGSGDEESDDGESAQTTVLGTALEGQADDAIGSDPNESTDSGESTASDETATPDGATDQGGSTASDETDTNETTEDDSGPLIPDAEETAAANTPASADDENTEEGDDNETDDTDEDDDDSEKGGFFSRLFGK